MANDTEFPIVDTCSYVLMTFLEKSKATSLADDRNAESVFSAKKIPKISISDYVARLSQYLDCSESCYISALLYLDRLVQKKQYKLTELNIHRLYLTAVIISIKFHDDRYYDNEYYSSVGGIELEELKRLETEMLWLLDFKLFVSTSKYGRYYLAMRNYHDGFIISERKGSKNSDFNESSDSRITRDE